MTALEYHDATKHYFNRFARSAGFLDWETQPDPFRRYAGAPLLSLPRRVVAPDVPYGALYSAEAPRQPFTLDTVGDFLRCAMGLSAWKQYQSSRWALRVNPSSGNLHPTEAYIVWDRRVYHYAPREHALEERCRLDLADAGVDQSAANEPWLLVGLTSIFWREAWKYGDRAFRYCQHDLGHALAALRFSAARLGWNLRLLPDWSDEDVSTLLGIARPNDYPDAEPEAPECLALVTVRENLGGSERTRPAEGSRRAGPSGPAKTDLVKAAGNGSWQGTANRLSAGHVVWSAIDDVAAATMYPGGEPDSVLATPAGQPAVNAAAAMSARRIIVQRRSAVAFDGKSSLPLAAFMSMLARLRPAGSPWDALVWTPHVHLALFVHRVEGLTPGIYAYVRDRAVVEEWQAAMRPQFLWEPVTAAGRVPLDPPHSLFLLLPFDMAWPATRVSCDQDIAGDGICSLAMVGRVGAVRERGDWFYRRLFWEAGMIGQVLYLEAEAAGVRATGIGCYYDDPVHELLGLPVGVAPQSFEWQSLYHLAIGGPVDDGRLTTEPGYSWEATTSS